MSSHLGTSTVTSEQPDIMITIRASEQAKEARIRFTPDGHYYDSTRSDHATQPIHTGTLPNQTFAVRSGKVYPGPSDKLTENGHSWYVAKAEKGVTVGCRYVPDTNKWVYDTHVPGRQQETFGYYSFDAEYPQAPESKGGEID